MSLIAPFVWSWGMGVPNKDRTKCYDSNDLLDLLANHYFMVRQQMHFSIVQMERNEYKWITNKIIGILIDWNFSF